MTISQQALNQVRSIIRELDERIASARQQRKTEGGDAAREGAPSRNGHHQPAPARERDGAINDRSAD